MFWEEIRFSLVFVGGVGKEMCGLNRKISCLGGGSGR